tara:strand:- start:2536 stop:3033 length:498 start_codon:yes stop_codon:yes gene_type:complete
VRPECVSTTLLFEPANIKALFTQIKRLGGCAVATSGAGFHTVVALVVAATTAFQGALIGAANLMAGGHEIAHHGWLHGRLRDMIDDEEAEDIACGVEAIKSATGDNPSGFRAPSYTMSHRTMSLLQDHGIGYDASLFGDDIPYLIKNERATMVELPSHMALHDWT